MKSEELMMPTQALQGANTGQPGNDTTMKTLQDQEAENEFQRLAKKEENANNDAKQIINGAQ
jgi:hypothetical protein